MVEYKNKLLRRIKFYQPDLSTVPIDFQRQATSRFIEGLDDADLKRKLRRHCKRDKLDIEQVFNYAVHSEASDLQTKIREGDAAAFSQKLFSSASLRYLGANPKEISTSRSNGGTSDNLKGIQEEMQGLAAKHKITEMQINELAARSALTDDRITIVSKEVGQVAVNMAKLENSMNGKFSSLESLIRANHSSNSNPIPNYSAQYGGQYGNKYGADTDRFSGG